MKRKSPFDLSQQNAHTDDKIVASLERISQAFKVLLWKESKHHALTPIQIQILIFLRFHSVDKRTVSYLAEEFNITKATVSDTIKTLLKKELIVKNQSAIDTRSYTIDLSPTGKKMAEETAHFTEQLLLPIQNMSSEEKQTLQNGLFTLIRHLNQTGVITVQRMCTNCRHYSKTEEGDHFCTLLNQPLAHTELRIDCPEHESK